MRESLAALLHQTYRELRPRAPLPEFELEFYPFTNLDNRIRLREGRLRLRLSDLLEGAPEAVLKAIVHILLAKIYRKPIDAAHAARYRRFVNSREMVERAHRLRQLRGRKRLESAKGRHYDLNELFDALNLRFFHGLLGRPQMSWSVEQARHRLGHYDPAHNAIVVSRVFDQPHVPRYAAEYIVFHEMLHLKHPVKISRGRRTVHGKEFREDEKAFPRLEEAQRFLRSL